MVSVFPRKLLDEVMVWHAVSGEMGNKNRQVTTGSLPEIFIRAVKFY
jgi:hypothetical protein